MEINSISHLIKQLPKATLALSVAPTTHQTYLFFLGNYLFRIKVVTGNFTLALRTFAARSTVAIPTPPAAAVTNTLSLEM